MENQDLTAPHLRMPETLQRNIEAMTDRAKEERSRATFSHRVAEHITAFTGSMTFVIVHLLLYSLWVAANVGVVPGLRGFDPNFGVLAMEASVEAIFLSTFVLISQNRMQEEADRRADLDLHINLLTEHELTKLATLVDRIAERLEISDRDPAMEEVKHDVRPVAVLDALDAHRSLP
jgi:uncharacterized membrane protein